MRATLLLILAAASIQRANALQVYLEVYSTDCDGQNGAVFATVENGVPPYTYLWSNASTDPEIYGLTPGEYSVVVTDGLGSQGTATRTVYMGVPAPDGSNLLQNVYYEGLSPCTGQCNGGARLYVLRMAGGTA